MTTEALNAALAILHTIEVEFRAKRQHLEELIIEAAQLFLAGNIDSCTRKLSEAADAEYELFGTTNAAEKLATGLGIYEQYDAADAVRVASELCPAGAPPPSSNEP